MSDTWEDTEKKKWFYNRARGDMFCNKGKTSNKKNQHENPKKPHNNKNNNKTPTKLEYNWNNFFFFYNLNLPFSPMNCQTGKSVSKKSTHFVIYHFSYPTRK